MADAYEWLDLPEGVTGQQVRCRKTFEGTNGRYRLGGAHPYVIAAETAEWVIVRPYSQDGRASYPEQVLSLKEFEEAYERKSTDG
jgi:hypothetical protein